jgi:hypothetical protein
MTLADAVVVAARGDYDLRPALQAELLHFADDPESAPLAATVQRILTGDRDPIALTQGLHPDHAAVVQHILTALTDPEQP